MEFGHHGSFHMVTNGLMILGSQMAPKVFKIIYGVELGKPNAFPVVGRSSVRKNDGVVGRGDSKKRRATCNELHRGLNLPRPERVLTYQRCFNCKKGGKTVNVRCSTKPKWEILTDTKTELQWDNIDWKTVYGSVNRLQTRITKAVKQKKWHLVKRLQYLLTHSHYAKMLAVRKVCQNQGRRTAGVDGVKWLTPETKMNAVLMLSDKKYKAKPLRRVYIKKYGKKEKRPISIPTMHDRAMQALYALALNPVAETLADTASFGFRIYRSSHDACGQVFICMSKKNSAQWVLEGDIKSCFDNINHNWLLANISMDKSVLKQFLKAGFVYNRHLFLTEKGTPQGGVISPILANSTLDGIAAIIDDKYHRGRGHNPKKVNFVRYADDFIVTADSEETASEVDEMIRRFLKERGLELSEKKTTITHIDDGFDFLGWNFRKYKGILLIKPSKKSIDKVTHNISDIIKGGKAWTQEEMIKKLNPVITGWSNYHQSVVSKDIFSKMDNKIWNMLWRWAKRRHKEKSKRWITNRYWRKEGTRNWVFSSEGKNLKLLSDTKIVRHTCLKLNKNPYLDKGYFEARRYKLRIRKMSSRCKAIGL